MNQVRFRARAAIVASAGLAVCATILPQPPTSRATPVAAVVTIAPLVRVSGASPFADCPFGGDTIGGISYTNSEADSSVAVDPGNADIIIGVFMQDPWSTNGARGVMTSHSLDGGATWAESWAAFSQCQGGSYVRASDPSVSIGPDGIAYQASLTTLQAVQVSTSTDHGATWGRPATVIADPPFTHANNQETVTADPYATGRAYLVWNREEFPGEPANGISQGLAALRGRPYFSMTADGGGTWSKPRDIAPRFDNFYSYGHQVVVEPDGTLIDVFNYLKGSGYDEPNASLIGLQRSTDRGATWSGPIRIADPAPTELSPQPAAPPEDEKHG